MSDSLFAAKLKIRFWSRREHGSGRVSSLARHLRAGLMFGFGQKRWALHNYASRKSGAVSQIGILPKFSRVQFNEPCLSG